MSWDGVAEPATGAELSNLDSCGRATKPANGRARQYALAALESECSTVAQSAPGTRNNTLNVAALKIGQLVAGGSLDEGEAVDALFAAAAQCGLGDREARATIRSGMGAGTKEPRTAPEPAPRANGSHAGPPPDDGFEHDDSDAPDAPAPDGDEPAREQPERQSQTIADVIAGWQSEGPLLHEPTGIARLDELTDGGPVYGTRWILPGAPDAGKTAFLVQLAHVYAARSIAVGLLAADEESGDLVTRLAQRVGWSRRHCETRDPAVLREMSDALSGLPIRLYDDSWTIESAAENLAEFALTATGGLAMLGIDSLQTVECETERLVRLAGGKELSTREAVTARARAVRSAAKRHRLITVATSEMNRSAYRSADAAEQSDDIASGAESRAIEYQARVMLSIRSVAGEKDIIEFRTAKNKHGPRGESVYLRLDRRSQTLTETDYVPPPAEAPERRADVARERVVKDAALVASALLDHPGLGVRKLRSEMMARAGLGHERVGAAVAKLGAGVVEGKGKRGGKPLTVVPERLPADVRAAMGADHD